MGEFHEKKERKKYEMMFEVKVYVSRKYSVLITFNYIRVHLTNIK